MADGGLISAASKLRRSERVESRRDIVTRAFSKKAASPQRPSPWMTPPEAAEYLCVSVATLARWRAEGFGPKWFSAGRRRRYRAQELDEWLEDRGAVSTAEARRRGL